MSNRYFADRFDADGLFYVFDDVDAGQQCAGPYPTLDDAEQLRAALVEAVNTGGIPESYRGPVWDTAALQDEFNVQGFAAPFVVVTRKSDNVRGTLTFVHRPRVYFDFIPA